MSNVNKKFKKKNPVCQLSVSGLKVTISNRLYSCLPFYLSLVIFFYLLQTHTTASLFFLIKQVLVCFFYFYQFPFMKFYHFYPSNTKEKNTLLRDKFLSKNTSLKGLPFQKNPRSISWGFSSYKKKITRIFLQNSSQARTSLTMSISIVNKQILACLVIASLFSI